MDELPFTPALFVVRKYDQKARFGLVLEGDPLTALCSMPWPWRLIAACALGPLETVWVEDQSPGGLCTKLLRHAIACDGG